MRTFVVLPLAAALVQMVVDSDGKMEQMDKMGKMDKMDKMDEMDEMDEMEQMDKKMGDPAAAQQLQDNFKNIKRKTVSLQAALHAVQQGSPDAAFNYLEPRLEPLKQLKEIFPEIDDGILLSTFDGTGGVPPAVELLSTGGRVDAAGRVLRPPQPAPPAPGRTAFILVGAKQGWNPRGGGQYQPQDARRLPQNGHVYVVDPASQPGRDRAAATTFYQGTSDQFFRTRWPGLRDQYDRTFIICYTVEAQPPYGLHDNEVWLALGHSGEGINGNKLAPLAAMSAREFTDLRAWAQRFEPIQRRIVTLRDRGPLNNDCKGCRERQYIELYRHTEWAQNRRATADPCVAGGACREWAAAEEQELADLRARSAELRRNQPRGASRGAARNVAAGTQRIADGLFDDIEEWHKHHIGKVSELRGKGHADRLLATSATFACGTDQCFVYG